MRAYVICGIAAVTTGACASSAVRAYQPAVATAAFPNAWDEIAAPVALSQPPAPVLDNPDPTAASKLPENIASVAVLPLQAKGGASPSLVEVLDDLVVSAMQAHTGQRLRVIGKSDIDAMLGFEKAKELVGCNDVACAVDMAGALGVDSILSATVGALGSKYILTLVWISQKEAKVIARRSDDLGGQVETFDTGVQEAVAALVASAGQTPPRP